jgi:hypothetical protein
VENNVKDYMKFDVALTKKNFEEWAADFSLNTQYDPQAVMGNIATHLLQDVIVASLVGMHEKIKPLSHRAQEWMDDAMRTDEDFGQSKSFYKERLASGKAMAKWINDSGEWCEAWREAAKWHKIAAEERGVYPPKKIGTEGLDEFMAECFQAGDFLDGIREFEKFNGSKNIPIGKKMKPREFAYVLCLNNVNEQYDPSDLLSAGRKMLSENLGDWLGGGLFTRAAMWLKIVYWHQDKSLTPLDTILMAYENMPGIVRPSFLTNE